MRQCTGRYTTMRNCDHPDLMVVLLEKVHKNSSFSDNHLVDVSNSRMQSTVKIKKSTIFIRYRRDHVVGVYASAKWRRF
jgi:predicted transcriptional regulator YheO